MGKLWKFVSDSQRPDIPSYEDDLDPTLNRLEAEFE
jgi:hypothetical protein